MQCSRNPVLPADCWEKAHRLLRGEVVLCAGPRCLIGGEGSQTGGPMPQVGLAPAHHMNTVLQSTQRSLRDCFCSWIRTRSAMTSAVPFRKEQSIRCLGEHDCGPLHSAHRVSLLLRGVSRAAWASRSSGFRASTLLRNHSRKACAGHHVFCKHILIATSTVSSPPGCAANRGRNVSCDDCPPELQAHAHAKPVSALQCGTRHDKPEQPACCDRSIKQHQQTDIVAKLQPRLGTCARLSSDMCAVCGGGECTDPELRRDVANSCCASAASPAEARSARRTAPTVLLRLFACSSAGRLPSRALLGSARDCCRGPAGGIRGTMTVVVRVTAHRSSGSVPLRGTIAWYLDHLTS